MYPFNVSEWEFSSLHTFTAIFWILSVLSRSIVERTDWGLRNVTSFPAGWLFQRLRCKPTGLSIQYINFPLLIKLLQESAFILNGLYISAVQRWVNQLIANAEPRNRLSFETKEFSARIYTCKTATQVNI